MKDFKVVKIDRMPRFTDHNGRTWDDALGITLPTGEKIYGCIDTTWGRWAYFAFNGKCFKVCVFAGYQSKYASIDPTESDIDLSKNKTLLKYLALN